MKILIVHNGLVPVTLYGGTERVVWGLGKALAHMGHDVTFMVKQGSYCDFAKVICIDERRSVIEQITQDYDVVHFHFSPPDIEKLRLPYVITQHGNVKSEDSLDINTVFVSQNHAQRHGSQSYVYNGLDWAEYQAPDFSRQRNYFHFLGKAAWRVKNLKGAINLIKRTPSEKLQVLGGVRFNFKMGLRFTFSPRIRFSGMVGGAEKDALLNGSKGLVFPVIWHEPFGLAITESLYYGCPVFGTPYGSLPELVNEDIGFLSNSLLELSEAIQTVDRFSRRHCYEYANELFNAHLMALRYLEKYEIVLNGRSLNIDRPHNIGQQYFKDLEWIED